jgi:oxygen-independent coproporphyrinogen-3 oxidase
MRSVSLAQTFDHAEALLRGASPAAAYVHVPFCQHKCHYCDFYSIVDGRKRETRYVERLHDELIATAAIADLSNLTTIFIGGGTPTLLEAATLARMLDDIKSILVEPAGGIKEWTIEVNPETLDAEKAEILVEYGVTRVSIGCQSFTPRSLKTLERLHDPRTVPRAVGYARAAGLKHINLDLIFGVPDSTLAEWEADLEAAIALDPDHLACYGLTFEPGTALYEKRRLGRMRELDDAIQIEMYNHTRDRLAGTYAQYEISNWAKDGGRCEHNLHYWQNAEWLAFGPAASAHIRGTRWRNIPKLEAWLSNGPFSPIVDRESPEPARTVGERLMLGLRLTDGLSDACLLEMLDADPPNVLRRQEAIDSAIATGMLVQADGGVRFSHDGVLQADGFLADLL